MFNFTIKVYYEDTDSGGVVYYANYLKFVERARTNLIFELGFTLKSLIEEHDCQFVVKNINCNFIKSAKLEDILSIHSKILKVKKASLELEQNIFRNEELIFKSQITIVNINSEGKPMKINRLLYDKMNENIY